MAGAIRRSEGRDGTAAFCLLGWEPGDVREAAYYLYDLGMLRTAMRMVGEEKRLTWESFNIFLCDDAYSKDAEWGSFLRSKFGDYPEPEATPERQAQKQAQRQREVVRRARALKIAMDDVIVVLEGDNITPDLPAEIHALLERPGLPKLVDDEHLKLGAWLKANPWPAALSTDPKLTRQRQTHTRLLAIHEYNASSRAAEAKGPAAPVLKGKPSLQPWTQADLDNAIRQYKAKRAAAYSDLYQAIKKNSSGAKKKAREMFGRNAIARALGVKSAAMVSKSPAWFAIAEGLGLGLNRVRRTGTRHTQLPGKIGHDIAVEEKSAAPDVGADNAPADQQLETAERQETIRRIHAMAHAGKTAKEKTDNSEAANVLIQKLQREECTDDQARHIVEMVLNREE